MKAADVMTNNVISIGPEASVTAAAKIMDENRISALPVIDDQNHVLGMVSEGDLIHRIELGTEKRHSWWLRLLGGQESEASGFIKSHARKVADVMTGDVISVPEDAPLKEVARLMERHQVKRLPVLREGKIVGIISRANIVRALASLPEPIPPVSIDDQNLQQSVIQNLKAQPLGKPWLVSAHVSDGVVTLWGPISSETERRALRVAAETTPGVRKVEDNTTAWRTPAGTD